MGAGEFFRTQPSKMKTRTQGNWAVAAVLIGALLSIPNAHTGLVQEGVETLRRARKAVEEKDWEAANGLARTALKLDPDSIEALRMVYQTSLSVNPELALETAQMLFQHPEASFEEKASILGYLQLRGEGARFVQLYDQLTGEQRKNPDMIFLKTRYLATQGAVREARSVLEEYFATGGEEARFRLLFSSLLIVSEDPKDQQRGQEVIAELMGVERMTSRVAFNLLGDAPPGTILPNLFPADIDAFVNALPEVRAQEKLIASTIKLAGAKDDATGQSEIFADALRTHQEGSLEMLCAWLSRFQRFDLILEAVDEKRGRESLALYDHRLRALTVVKGPEAAEEWLQNPHEKSSGMAVWMMRAKLAAAKKDGAGALEAWEKAFGLADKEKKAETFVALYRNGLEIGQLDAAVKAVLEAAKNPSGAFPASSQLQPAFEHLYEDNRLEDLLLLTWTALSREKNNLHLVNNFIYISMVLNREGNDYVAQAGKVVEALPDVAGLRSTLAFAFLRAGQFAEALKVLEDVKVEWSKEPPSSRAIRAVALEKNGRKEEAVTEWKALEECYLATAEKKAFDRLLGRNG